MQNTKKLRNGSRLVNFVSAWLMVFIGIFLVSNSAEAGGVVTTASETELESALAGGGPVSFTFDGVITLTTTKVISNDTVLDATGREVTISGGNNVQIFRVNPGVTLTLSNLTLANGRATNSGGAIFNEGTVIVQGGSFRSNQVIAPQGAAGQDGAPRANGTAGATGGNALGGAIFNVGGLTLERCLFSSNSVVGGNGGTGGKGGDYDLSGPTGGNGGAGGTGGVGYGGAIFSTNSVALTNCSFIGNSAVGGNGGGGGLKGAGQGGWNDVSRNGQGGRGGEGSGPGIYSHLALTVVRTTFADGVGVGGNSALAGTESGGNGSDGYVGGQSLGGGICNLGTNAVVINCTFFNNRVFGGTGGAGSPGNSSGGDGGNGGLASGGGLYSLASIGITNCTFSTNGVTGGGGGAAGSGSFPGSAGSTGSAQGANIARAGGAFTLKNSLLAYKVAGANSFGTITDAGHNISSDNTPTLSGVLGSTNNLDPKLSLLADNGGWTKTCALLATSPAINSADNAAAPLQDQRGYFRNNAADIGAFEFAGESREVRVFANGAIASEDGETGLFTVERSTATTNALTVFFTVTGTASNGIDYVTIPDSVTIPAHEWQVRVFVRPIADTENEGSETVELTLVSNPTYEIVSPASATIALLEQSNYDRNQRYVRGTGSDPTLHSFVIPLDFQTGTRLDPIGGVATNFFPAVSWGTFYHYDATNAAAQNYASNRIAFQNPMVAFGARFGGTPLYLNQAYEFGIYAGDPYIFYDTAVAIKVYARSNSAWLDTVYLPIPDVFDTGPYPTHVNESFTTITEMADYGLVTVLSEHPYQRWGNRLPGAVILRHTASTLAATNFFFVVEYSGYGADGGGLPLVINSSGFDAWSKLYVMEFNERPALRATFLDQPHFEGEPLPPAYWDKSITELLNNAPTLPDLSELSHTNYLALNHSPELRRHPILDQLVSDMRRDPLVLANYVLNEIELTDALDYDTNLNSQAVINLGGVNRSALATFQEGRGSPLEQCALLIYLLREAGVPAAYVFPTNNGMKMLDVQLSKLLRFQVRGALSPLGQTNLPALIGVNYPWVAAYVGSNWVHVFPWLKDTEVIEGLDLYDYLPPEYNTGHKWLQKYVQNDATLMALSASDQPMELFPKFIEQQLSQNHPGLSLADIGVKYLDRRRLYSRWDDFPKPFELSGAPIAKESLTNDLNLFNTIRVRVYSQANPNKFIDTEELRIADLHNRKLQLKFLRVGNQNIHDMILSLDAYAPTITNLGGFSTNANPAYRLVQTNQLNATDDVIKFRVTHKRLRALPTGYVAPLVHSNLWNYSYFEQGSQSPGLVSDQTETFRKGDLVTFCLDVGRVTSKMLNVHAETIWQHHRTATNSTLTNPDIYQGTVAYLAGMAYWEYCDRFNERISRWHKIHRISNYGLGFSLLRPQRDASDLLVSNGVVNLVEPVLHVPQNGGASVFNGTLRPDVGRDFPSAHWDWFMVKVAQGSAAEHGILESFYGTNAISTVKLLQLSGTNILNLNRQNYLTEGETVYHGKKLKLHDPDLWARVDDHFNSDGYPDYYKQALLTRGTMTNGTYRGAGAFLIGFNAAEAAISGLLDGGNAHQLPESTFSADNSPNLTLQHNSEDSVSPFRFVTAPVSSGEEMVPTAPLTWLQQQYFEALIENQITLDPLLWQAAMQGGQLGVGGLVDPLAGYQWLHDRGAVGKADWFDEAARFVADPVNAVSGEFYLDVVDLSLPGPLPLQVRRNYSSHNLVENQMGFGWKLNYMSFLSVSTNELLIYAAEPEGSVIAYEQTTTNSHLWLPSLGANPNLSNKGNSGIGSTANPLQGRIERSIVSGTNVYTLFNANGTKRTFVERAYPIGVNFTRQRPYLTQWEDHRGNFYTFDYGEDATKPDYGEVRRIQSSNGSFLGFYYDVYGRIIEAYTGDGRRLTYAYDKFGDLISVTRPDASQISYTYQHATMVTNSVTNVYSLHLLTRESKPDGRVLVNEYDSERRITNQLATVGIDLVPIRNATFVYANNFTLTNAVTNLVTGFTVIKDIFNHTNRYEYTNNLITRIIDFLGQTEEQHWFADGAAAPGFPRSLWKTKDKRGLWTEFSYDAFGNVTNSVVTGDLTGTGTTQSVTNSISYNAAHLPTLTIDPTGNKVQTIYHSQFAFLPEYVVRFAGDTAVSTNRMFYTSATNTVSSGATSYTNLAVGLLHREVRAFGSADAATNDYVFDGRGFITQSVRYSGTSDSAVTNTFFYNDRQELTEQTDAAGRKTRLDYDAMSRPILREVFEVGQSVPTAWDFSYYNENGELTWTDGPRYNPEDYVWRDYDGAGRLTTEIRWRSQARADGLGVEASAGDDLFAQAFHEYDGFGNLTRSVNPRGASVTNIWDSLGQLVQTKAIDLDGTTLLRTEGFAYEPGGQVRFHTNALGGVTENQYTTTGQIKFQRHPDGSTNAWRYYADGRIQREIQRNGAYLETAYNDALRKVTKVFHSATGVPLATNITELDRRGNPIKRTDAAGFVFTTSYDGLDRVKVVAGPPIVTVKEVCATVPNCGNWVTNVLQQASTNFYDAAGVWLTNVNALGEKTISRFDALGRNTRTEMRLANNALVRETSTFYSPDHHSITVTNGAIANAVVSTTFTDNDGHTVLSVAYPHVGTRDFTRNEYDLAGNLIFAGRYAATNAAAPVFFSGVSQGYDGLNRVIARADRDGAMTTLAYNALGQVTNRTLAGGLAWHALYNNAGKMVQEWNTGAGGIGIRTNSYIYYSASSPFAGLLHTNIDGRAVTCTHYYDDWLRPATNLYLNTIGYDHINSWQYDVRGLVTEIYEAPAPGEPVVIQRTYDAYGQLASENSASQNWDAAGRRTRLNIGQISYGFDWRPDGRLASVANNFGSASYGYNLAGALTNRSVGTRASTVNSLDGMGRPLAVTTTVGLLTKLTESLTWTGDGLLDTHTVRREDFTNAASYAYAPESRRLTEERLNLNAVQRWTNSFTFDSATTGGLGALTKVESASGWSGALDAFFRSHTETNASIRRQAFGRVNGPAAVTATLDGHPVSVRLEDSGDSAWSKQWWSLLELTPGAHQLTVSASHPSGLFATNTSVWFTNNTANEIVVNNYDGAGNLKLRIWKGSSGQTNRLQGLEWDHKGRLTQVLDLDHNKNGFHWVTAYDGLNRRVVTYEVGISNAFYLFGPSERIITHYYDPLVEFLELGVAVDDTITWKLYGPDLNGIYGGLNGSGGLEGAATGIHSFQPTLADARGNLLGAVLDSITVRWTDARVTGFGAVPGKRPLPLGRGADVIESSAWRGRPMETTGYVWLGARFYNPESGSFLSSDPVWNGRDPNYYTFAGGDPINYFDADGRVAKKAAAVTFDVLATIFATIATPQPPPFAYVSPLEKQIYENRARMIHDAVGHPFQDAGYYQSDSRAAAIRDVAAMSVQMYGVAKAGQQMVSVNVSVPQPVWTLQPVVASPNATMRVNANTRGNYTDPLTGNPVLANGTLAADHIVPQIWIKQQPGFNNLSPQQQNWVLNHPLNTQGLPQSLNSSKGAQMPGDWTTYKGQPLNPQYVQSDALRGQMLQNWIQQQINTFNSANRNQPGIK
jgi:RHS repeat-associated protein